jgi:glycosyltransferase involved in cell wall biosynthesis
VHDLYANIEQGSVGGEDNIAQIEIMELEKLGHEVVPVLRIQKGMVRKYNQTRSHILGLGESPLPKLIRDKVDVVHTHNLNQISGYNWIKNSPVPVVSSLHNFRSFCSVSIAWRDGNNCFECLQIGSMSAIRNRCGGFRGLTGSLRHTFFQRGLNQLHDPTSIIVTNNFTLNLLKSYVKHIELLPNPGLPGSERENINRHRRWLFAGRFVEEKNLQYLIRNFPKEHQLDIAGNGPLLQEILKEINLHPNIKYIGTFHPSDRGIYKEYSGLIFCSNWVEGSPLVIADAISNGTPVIVSAGSSAIEQVNRTGCGVIISRDFNVDELRSAMSLIEKEGEALRAKCQNEGAEILSTQRWATKLETILRRALQNTTNL